jgi:hypothetical protein
MPKSKLLEDLEKQTTNKLLKSLIEVYKPSSETTQDQKTLSLVNKLRETYEGRLNETHKH